jgi:hypothetical protein
VEIFEGKMMKKTVNYANFKHTTHAALVLLTISGVAFHAALWPHYGWNSPVIMILVTFGVIVQFLLLVPTWISNIVGFVGLTFFLQQYS